MSYTRHLSEITFKKYVSWQKTIQVLYNNTLLEDTSSELVIRGYAQKTAVSKSQEPVSTLPHLRI